MVKTLTLHQPWASLVALGVKSIETRSWATPYRGRLLIHAGAKQPPSWVRPVGEYALRPFGRVGWAMEGPGLPPYRSTPRTEGYMVPWGKIVASCTLADVVPMIGTGESSRTGHLWTEPGDPLTLWRPTVVGSEQPWTHSYVEDERPYGDFAPGRFAWLLEDVKPTTERCPACWGTGMAAYGAVGCATCNAEGVCDPVSARGRQRLWDWTPSS